MSLLRRSAALALAGALTTAAAAAQTPQPRPTYYLFVYAAGPAWKAGQPMSAQDLGPHGMYMTKLFEQGVVLAGGPIVNPEGGLAIVRAKDIAEAKALLAADPAVRAGIMTGEVRAWRPFLATKEPLLP